MKDIYIQAFFGGTLIGLSAILLMLLKGRIAGISGILQEAVLSIKNENAWRWSFLAGLIAAPLLTAHFGYDLPTSMSADLTTLIIAGLLVGIGTQIGSGCTSGHGICGIGRLSKRSIAATLTFMATAIITVAVNGSLF